MNNKGFIATSLIYSFFLIFITLFLTIIADHLQNKVLLNTIENGIKDELNNTKGIEDFDVGDILTFSGTDATSINSFLVDKSVWIVAGMQYDNKDTEGNDAKLILYNMEPTLTGSIPNDNSTYLTTRLIEEDLKLTGNLNSTRISELINNSSDAYLLYDNSENKSYEIKEYCFKRTFDTNLNEDKNDYSACPPIISATKYRQRLEISNFDTKFQVTPKSMGGFNIEGVVS